MSKCSECTHLNANRTNLYGKYWCEENEKYVFLNNESCNSFSWEVARQSYLNNEYNNFLDGKFNFSVKAVFNILRMPQKNNFASSLDELITIVGSLNSKLKKEFYDLDKTDYAIYSCLMNDPMKENISLELFFEYLEPINALIKIFNGIKTFRLLLSLFSKRILKI